MTKKLFAYCSINVFAIICASSFLWLHYNPAPFNDLGMTRYQTTHVNTIISYAAQYAREIFLLAGFCTLLLVGCLFWVLYREIKNEKHVRVDEDLTTQEDMKTASLKDWAIALLVFPGCLIIPVFIAVFFGFSHFW